MFHESIDSYILFLHQMDAKVNIFRVRIKFLDVEYEIKFAFISLAVLEKTTTDQIEWKSC